MDNGIHIIKASAGSGKTYTLAKDYIKLLLCEESASLLALPANGKPCEKLRLRPIGNDYSRNSQHEHILAITFTNAATAEMKERIIDQLYWLGQGDEDRCKYIGDFKKELQYNDFSEVEAAARKALSNILFNYNTFNVSTIDSFFQSILRTFARELDCDYNYDIQLDSNYAIKQAAQSLLSKLGTRGSNILDQWIKNLVEHKISEGKNPNVFSSSKDLESLAKDMRSEQLSGKMDEIRQYLSDRGSGNGISRISQFTKWLKETRKQLEESILASEKKAAEQITMLGIDVSHMKYAKFIENMLVPGYFDQKRDVKKIATDYKKRFTGDDSPKRLERGYFFKKGTADDEIDAFHNHVLPLLTDIAPLGLKYELISDANDKIWNVGLLGALDTEIEKFRIDNNLILMDDTNDMVKKVIDSGVPFMYERIGTQTSNYMIDEFQDTSTKQYHNFKMLLDESCSTGHNDLIIGDEKQSIYRFRNSDPNLLLYGIEKDFGDLCQTYNLSANHRSMRQIIEFNNCFFTRVKESLKSNPDTARYEKLQRTYQNIEQTVGTTGKKSTDRGYVEINIVSKSQAAEAVPAEEIKLHVPRLIDDLRQRGYHMKDIGVLVNKNKEGNDIVSAILQYNEKRVEKDSTYEPIQIMSSESLRLINSPQVRLIVSVLQFLDTTHLSGSIPEADDNGNIKDKFNKKRFNDQRLYSIIHDFEHKVADQEIPEGPSQDKNDMGQMLLECLNDDLKLSRDMPQQTERMAAYFHKVEHLLPDYRTEPMNLTSIVDRIIKQYVLNDGKQTDERKVGTSYLLAFQNVVNDFVAHSNSGTIREFLKYWADNGSKLTVPSPADADAVQIMTIHKSKGLEFKCVIIPLADWDLEPKIRQSDTTWIPRELWAQEFGLDSTDIVPPVIPIRASLAPTVETFKVMTDKEFQDSLIDNLNKTYVAFTRPKTELYVFTAESGEKGQVGKCIAETVMGMEHETENPDPDWPEGLDVEKITFGCKPGQVKQDDAAKEQQPDMVLSVDMPQYYVNIASPEMLKVSLPEFCTPEQEAGNSLHRLLSRLGTARDLERTITFGKTRNIIADSKDPYWTAERMEAAIRRLVTEQPTSEWYGDELTAYNERTISYIDKGHNLRHKRPDRVVRRPDGSYLVIDYKTGDDEAPDVVQRYRRQVKGYMQMIARATGCTRIEGRIINLQSWHIIDVND